MEEKKISESEMMSREEKAYRDGVDTGKRIVFSAIIGTLMDLEKESHDDETESALWYKNGIIASIKLIRAVERVV